MKTISETAHAQNISSFEQLVTYLSSHQVAFKSKNKVINHAELKQLSAEAKTASQKVDFLTDEYCKALTKREKLFESMPIIGNNLQNLLPSLNIEKDKLDACLKAAKKLSTFQPISNASLQLLCKEVKETAKHLREIDKLEPSYTKIIQNFSLLIAELEKSPSLKPKSPKLSLPSLNETLLCIDVANSRLSDIRSQIIKARMGRTAILYKEDEGLVDVAHDTKVYIKRCFGGESKEWKEVSSIPFKRIM